MTCRHDWEALREGSDALKCALCGAISYDTSPAVLITDKQASRLGLQRNKFGRLEESQPWIFIFLYH